MLDQSVLPLSILEIPAPEAIRPRPWIYGHWAMRGAVTLISAPGGTGKTSYVTSMMLACATGRDLLDDQPIKPLNVAFLGLEESTEEMQRRFAAAMLHHGITETDIDHRIVTLDSRSYGFQAAVLDDQGQVCDSADIANLRDILSIGQFDMLIVDPLALAHPAQENDNTAMAQIMRIFSHLSADCDCATILVHHTRKGAQAGDPDGIRGAGALINHARIAIGFSPMGDDDRVEFGLSKDDQRYLVRIDDLKRNYSPRAAEARWIKLESVRLGNETTDYPFGDSIQVPVIWTPPQAQEAYTAAIANEVLDRIDKGIGEERYSAAPAAQGKAAYKIIVMVMREHGHTITDAQARKIIRNYLDVQPPVLREESYVSPNDRKARIGLFVNHSNRP